jgi:hypothetical protein
MVGSASLHSTVVREAARRLHDPRTLPSVAWIQLLTGRSRRDVVDILDEAAEFLDVESTIRARHREGGRTFYAQFRAPLDLYAVVRLTRPDHVVETGVSSGVSSAHVLLALRRNGHGKLHSIDLPVLQAGERLRRRESPVSLPPGRSSGWAIPPALRRGWDLHQGPSEVLLPKLLSRLPTVGVFLHDDLHTEDHLGFQLSRVRPKLRPGGVVLADNTVWTGDAFPRFAESLGVEVHRRRGSDLVGLQVP